MDKKISRNNKLDSSNDINLNSVSLINAEFFKWGQATI